MNFFNNKSIEEVYKEIEIRAKNYKIESEEISILEAFGRIVYSDVESKETVPAFSRSTVDGYAINSKDTFGASSTIPSMIKVVEKIEMGKSPEKAILSGECSYIPTGGMLPEGADSVVMIENTELLDEETVMIYKALSDGTNILKKGDDVTKGNILIKKGKKINSYDIGLLASQGIEKIEVFRKLKFTVISTGDEIIDLDEDITEGKIRDINSFVITSDLKSMNHEVINRIIVKDEYEKLKDIIKEGVESSDIVLISGGSSVGTKDYTSNIIKELGNDDVFIHGIAIKPGKPTIVGQIDNKLIFGLPGHPASAIIIYNIVVKRCIENILNMHTKSQKFAYCKIDSNFPSSPGKTTYQMVKVYEKDNELRAKPVFGKSGMISLLSGSDGYLKIDSDEEGVYKDTLRKVIYL